MTEFQDETGKENVYKVNATVGDNGAEATREEQGNTSCTRFSAQNSDMIYCKQFNRHVLYSLQIICCMRAKP